jgi:hypothetical protein
MPMSRKVAEEMLPRLRQRYMGRGREGRQRMIDEICEQWGQEAQRPAGLPDHSTGLA